MLTKVIAIAALCVGVALATPLGAPQAACVDMTPQHPNGTVSPNPSPYTFDLTQTSSGASLTITAATGDWFRGFFVQFRDANGAAVGTFNLPANAKTIDCAPNLANAATHNDPSDKTSITIDWVAPSPPVPVTVLASTVRVVLEYWAAQEIGQLTY